MPLLMAAGHDPGICGIARQHIALGIVTGQSGLKLFDPLPDLDSAVVDGGQPGGNQIQEVLILTTRVDRIVVEPLNRGPDILLQFLQAGAVQAQSGR